MLRPLPRPSHRRFLPLVRHILRTRAEALATKRQDRAGSYAPPHPATNPPAASLPTLPAAPVVPGTKP